MGRSVAVAIGVEQSGDLVPLPGAVEGAREFASWAEDPEGGGFDEVLLLTDEDGPVDGQLLFRAIRSQVEHRGVERLFVFFAGHGVSLGVDVDYWLLSPGPDDTTDGAVNVANSRRLARRLGIPHVAIFADHCRTVADKPRQGVHGRDIFPNLQVVPRAFELDEFYAALPGMPSQEVSDEESEASFGIFTRVLLRALTGRDDGPAELVDLDGERRRVVSARTLRDWIVDAVELESDRTPGAAVQRPDARPGSYPPNVLAVLPTPDHAHLRVVAGHGVHAPARARLRTAPALGEPFTVAHEGALPVDVDLATGTYCKVELTDPPPALRQDDASARGFRLTGDHTVRVALLPDTPGGPGAPPAMRSVVVDEEGEHLAAAHDGVAEVRAIDGLTGRVTRDLAELATGERPRATPPTDPAAVAAVASLTGAVGRDGYETRTGITIIGAELDPDGPRTAAIAPWGHAGIFREDGRWHVRAPTMSGSALVHVGDGRRVAVAAMVGFDCTVVVDEVGARHVAYNGLDDATHEVVDGDPDPWDVEDERLRRAMAIASVAASRGRFEVTVDESLEVAHLLRRYRHRNPTLAILAAYAYDRAGRVDEIAAMVRDLAANDQPVPHDVLLLSGMTDADVRALSDVPVVPAWPMLTQGWAYLDEADVPAPVWAARGSLAPTLWATVTGGPGRALAEAVDNGALR